MSADRLFIFDTTLRDGEQSPGASMTKEEKMRIAPAVKLTLEEALEYIQSDEYVEVTPKSIRLRKIYLNENDRKRERNKVLVNE